ncbi:phosphoribosylamine--glycine ligase [Selenomonas sp. oral taxon 149]|uniref:phosphoribosylamine--glycine ligase n=1 Tax=Selenomonas sp. oral taxon 149 TaxID=712535 RepID=UPI0001E08760|nr:phosphoribosylamine--glycine ligase [Selenomonas sp. oral taxon 149]EFM24037.1 phosphoribosylamine--glycine ligase [Selenomonas sp. oral taxon 149 str. 67H29BP]
MNILVIGSGGREHALYWKLSESPQTEQIYAIPGNPGMDASAAIALDDHAKILRFVKEKDIGLVVVGPEVPLMNGLVDELEAAGIRAFGPRANAAEIEVSKSFAKDLMKKYGIPTARYEVFTAAEPARAYIRQEGAPIVVKADGLAAGKGVIVAMTEQEALDAVDAIMEDHSFGDAGARVVIEEFMEGEEASLLAFTDGTTIRPMISAQDHKRAYDGDRGPNTGGMGTYAPAPVMTPEMTERAVEEILKPTIAAMAKEGRIYRGCLYLGLMVTADGPKVVEFNARFGDPETQVVLPLLDSDLVTIMCACADGTLADVPIRWKDGAAVCVVLASGGYPGHYDKGQEIHGLADAEAMGALVFHAGTAMKDGKLVTNGGRVLGVVGRGADISSAVDAAYAAATKISFKDAYYRKDIAHRALGR